MMHEQSLQEFIVANKKPAKGRKAKVTGSFGVYDAYKSIRKNHWFNIGRVVSEKEFYSVIRSVNKLLAENILNGQSVTFPENMGMLELRKFEVGVSLVNGKLKNTYPIDWAKTWKLWYDDEDARKNKILIRDEQRYLYRVRYCKEPATYENKIFYQFSLNTFIKKQLGRKIKQGKIDTLW